MQIASFRVADGLYGVPVLIVEEFFRPIPVTNIPLTDSRIEGLVHHRGKTATVLDLRSCLDKPAVQMKTNSKMILLETNAELTPDAIKLGIKSGEEPVVLRVDRTESIINAEEKYIKPRPAHIPYDFVEGVFRLQHTENYLMLLNIATLVKTILQSTGSGVE